MQRKPKARPGLGFGSEDKEGKPFDTTRDRESLPLASSTGSSTRAKLAQGQPVSTTNDFAPASTSKQRKMQEQAQHMLDKAADQPKSASKSWERQDMKNVAEKFKADEASMGFSNADSEKVVETIRRIEDESRETIFNGTDGFDGDVGIKSDKSAISTSELTHHDAMFTAGLLEVEPKRVQQEINGTSSTLSIALSTQLSSLGKTFERPPSPSSSNDSEVPLYKRLQVGQPVKARFSEDGCWHSATIKQVTHGGFPNATFTVLYTDYGNEESRCWREIMLLPGDDGGGLSSTSEEQDGKRLKRESDDPSTKEHTEAVVPAVPLNPATIERALAPSKKGGGWRAKARRK